jgi:hypothetical protein
MRTNRAPIVVPGSTGASESDHRVAGKVWATFLENNKDRFRRTITVPIGELLGCGLFGCVYESTSPWVVKLTRDKTEGPIWAYMAELLTDPEVTGELNAFLRVDDVVRVQPDVLFDEEEMPIYCVVREEALPVLGEPGLKATKETLRRIGLTPELLGKAGIHEPEPSVNLLGRRMDAFPEEEQEALADFYSLIVALKYYRQHALVFHQWRGRLTHSDYGGLEQYEAEEIADAAFRGMLDAIDGMKHRDRRPNRFGLEIGTTLAAAVNFGDLVFQDLHLYNIGWRIHETIKGDRRPPCMVILDPGAMATPYSPEIREVELMLANFSRKLRAH